MADAGADRMQQRVQDTSDAGADRLQQYILDGSDEDLRRLLRLAELAADDVRSALSRVGAGPGWAMLDCGCGPLGALAVMADVGGAQGRAVGVDLNAAAVARAREVAATLGLTTVEVVHADVNDVTPDAFDGRLGGPFDLAYTRCFLMHQPDPVHTLSRIAALLRPGGWILAHEPLPVPAPRSYPEQPALAAYWDLVHRTLQRSPVPPPAVDELPRCARAAGLAVVRTGGVFGLIPPALGFDVHAGTLAALRDRAVQSGAADAAAVDDVLAALRAAARDGSGPGGGWVSGPFYLDLALRKPAPDEADAAP